MKIASKISAKAVLGNKDAILSLFAVTEHGTKGSPDYKLVREPNPEAGFIIAGVAKRAEVKDTDYGESVCFVGNFKAVNKQTGEELRSGKCYLPNVAANLLEGAMAGRESVEFVFHIGVQPDSDSPVGYSYTATSLMQRDESDPLDLLIKTGVPQLAAPPAKEPAPEKNPEPAAKDEPRKTEDGKREPAGKRR